MEVSAENRLNFESVSVPEPTLSTNSETATISIGLGHRVAYPRLETAGIYKVSKLKLLRRGEEEETAPPWSGVPPALEVYRERGHRRLAVTPYDAKCNRCIWGRAMPVEIIVDHWNPDRQRYRTEKLFVTDRCPALLTRRVQREKFQAGTA